MASLSETPGLPRLERRSPPTVGPVVDRAAIAAFREQLLDPSGVSEPTVLALDLEGRFPTAAVLFELVVPVGQAARAGTYGPLAVVVCTSDRGVHDVLRALAETYDLTLFWAPSVDRLSEAEPLGALTTTERETLEVVQRLGGRVNVARFAEATGLAAPAATNRLVNVVQKGFVQKLDRSRREGVLYLDPRAAAPLPAAAAPALPVSIARELAIFAALGGRSTDELLRTAVSEYDERHGPQAADSGERLADAWIDYRRRHGGELNEGLRWAQSVLADAGEASIQASGMPDETLERLRREFE